MAALSGAGIDPWLAHLVEGSDRRAAGGIGEEVRSLAHPVQGAGGAARLLVGHGGEDDVASQLGTGAAELEHDRQFHGDHLLHVAGAAAPDLAVDQLATERVARPGLGVDRHHVDVRQ
jgi:hypothetical protein